MSRSVAVLPRASLALRPICCSKVWLTASRQPSVRRAMTMMSGQLWNTEANFCSERRSACSVCLASVMSIIRPRIISVSPWGMRVMMSRTQSTRPSAAIIR
ncbi:hypothetical protein D3C72_1954630 [compost metagenome]